jgi:general secretion pathway protein G
MVGPFPALRQQRGFTLLELLISVAIIATLASIAMPLTSIVSQQRKEQELRSMLREIRSAIDAYKLAADDGRIAKELDQSGYPPSLKSLVEGVADAKSANGGKKLYFLRRIPRDPMASDPELEPEASWALRSYASSADHPMPGKDVFDIRSRSTAIGLNGIPYSKW